MKYCHTCVEYRKLYLKGKEKFFYAAIGYCELTQKTITEGKPCECWKRRPPTNTEVRKQEVCVAIVKAVEYLAQLKQIVEEDFQK